MDWIESLLTWLVQQVENFGYLGIFVMMFLESTFFPFPSEVAMIPAGFLASRGRMDMTLAVLAGLLGSLAGAYFNYYLARIVGVPVLRRYGKYVLFDEAKLDRASAVFRRHGEVATFVCRLIPVVRQYISLPAGIAGMNLARFGFYTGAGAGLWVFVLALFGYWIGDVFTELESSPDWEFYKERWQEWKRIVYPVTAIFLAAVIVAYIIIRRRRARSRPPPPSVEDGPG